jgi:hypothetical protein
LSIHDQALTGLDHGVGHPMPFEPRSLLAAAD